MNVNFVNPLKKEGDAGKRTAKFFKPLMIVIQTKFKIEVTKSLKFRLCNIPVSC